MKFENNRFRIIVERKALDEEGLKEKSKDKEKKKSRKSRSVIGAAALLLAGAGIFFGYTNSLYREKAPETPAEKEESFQEPAAEGNYVAVTHLAQSVKEKYKDKELYAYAYGEPIKGVKRDDTITIPVGFDLNELEFEYWYDLFAIYQDAGLTNRLAPVCEYDDKKRQIRITPPHYTVGNIQTVGLTVEEVRKYDHNDFLLFAKDAGNDWGNVGTLYLAKYIDMESGELLKEPEVSIITLEGEVKERPRITFSVSEDGRAALSWEPVKGAEEYFICLIDRDKEEGYNGNAKPIAVTSENTWVLESPEYSSFTKTNEMFKNFDVCEDDWLDEGSAQSAEEWYGVTEGVYKEEDILGEKYLCILAVNNEGTSMLSNTYAVADIASNLPYCIAANAEQQNGFKSNGYESIEQVSSYGYVTMCDGYTAAKLIDYQTEKARVKEERYVTIDEEGEYIEGQNVPVLEIPYVVEGTPFEYVAKVIDYDEEKLTHDLQFLEDRENKLRKKSGDVALKIEWGREEEDIGKIARKQKVREVEDVRITANSALSEYLAAGMLGGLSIIDLTDFPEADDKEYLTDAWMEAYYQNPLILGAKGYKLNKNGSAMRVYYDDSMDVTAGKQREIQRKVSEIIDRIISDGMTDLEKELAINEYLCDTIEYDENALENAEKNNFTSVDEKFADSFTAYGALINGKCVCAGYASAFKLLADEAGLETIVVTGFLEGSLSHAWNKVKIDGEWEILDVTNNDNEYLFNALLNLPDYAGDRVLVEDEDYVLNKYLSAYDATHNDNEYYRIKDKYYDFDSIAYKLAEDLEEEGYAQLRTEYDLDDDMFYEIADGIYDKLGDDIDLYGHYWLGVIYLSIEN